MSCAQIEPELVAYHFGEVDEPARDRIEAHLLDCRACLSAFVEIKREIETAGPGAAPAPQARARLRRAVAVELGLEGTAPRRWSWWERPLAFGVATAALVAAVLILRLLAASPGSLPHSLAIEKAVHPEVSTDT